ncbi:MAG: sulfotransferase [Pseudomonadota bacterium]
MTRGRLPDFVIVGAPKAGTSALFTTLQEHPDLYIGTTGEKRGEPNYFCHVADGWPRWGISNEADYRALFEAAAAHQTLGEKSTWYLSSVKAPQYAFEQVPNLKAIACLRDPVTRAHSAYLFNKQMGWEDQPSFKAALALEEARIADGALRDLYYFNTGAYAAQIDRWKNTLKQGHFLTVLHDDFVADRTRFLASVTDFLGVADFADDVENIDKVNVTSGLKSYALKRALNRVRGTSITKLLPTRARYHIGKAIGRANKTEKPKLDPETAHDLAVRYLPDVERLSSTLDIDLKSLWLDKHLA